MKYKGVRELIKENRECANLGCRRLCRDYCERALDATTDCLEEALNAIEALEGLIEDSHRGWQKLLDKL
jgi:hypothetical protein